MEVSALRSRACWRNSLVLEGSPKMKKDKKAFFRDVTPGLLSPLKLGSISLCFVKLQDCDCENHFSFSDCGSCISDGFLAWGTVSISWRVEKKITILGAALLQHVDFFHTCTCRLQQGGTWWRNRRFSDQSCLFPRCWFRLLLDLFGTTSWKPPGRQPDFHVHQRPAAGRGSVAHCRNSVHISWAVVWKRRPVPSCGRALGRRQTACAARRVHRRVPPPRIRRHHRSAEFRGRSLVPLHGAVDGGCAPLQRRRRHILHQVCGKAVVYEREISCHVRQIANFSTLWHSVHVHGITVQWSVSVPFWKGSRNERSGCRKERTSLFNGMESRKTTCSGDDVRLSRILCFALTFENKQNMCLWQRDGCWMWLRIAKVDVLVWCSCVSSFAMFSVSFKGKKRSSTKYS